MITYFKNGRHASLLRSLISIMCVSMIKDVRSFPLFLVNSFVVPLLLRNLVSAQFPKIEMLTVCNVTYQERMVWYLRLEPSNMSSLLA